MKARLFAGMLTVLAIPTAAWASPEAPSTPEELEADRAYIRSLNLRQLAFVQQRDAQWARQREADREAQQEYEVAYSDYVRNRAEFLHKRNAYQSEMNRYSEQRRSYEMKMEAWRRDVAACRAGHIEACAN
ncbi:MAG: hypothetical protein AB7F98_06165 [Novosphingobium sp.]